MEFENIKIVVPLKHLSRFIFNVDTLLTNSEIELKLKWSQDWVLTSKATRDARPARDDPAVEPEIAAINAPFVLKFSVTDCMLYVPVVTLQAECESN